MAWGTIRKATTEDEEALEQAAVAFVERHGIPRGEESAVRAVEYYIIASRNDRQKWLTEGVAYTRSLWLRCVRRALKSKSAEGIAYGYVGYYVD